MSLKQEIILEVYMAEWTDYQYGFYTNKPIDFVLSEWRKKVLAINYKYDYSIDEGDKFFILL